MPISVELKVNKTRRQVFWLFPDGTLHGLAKKIIKSGRTLKQIAELSNMELDELLAKLEKNSYLKPSEQFKIQKACA